MSLALPYPEDMLQTYARNGCARCQGRGHYKLIVPGVRITLAACKCALKRIQRRAKQLNRFADMLDKQEN